MFDEVALSEGVSKERNALLVLSTLPLTPLVRDMSIVQPLQFTEIPPNNFFDSPYREGGARYNLNAKIDTKRLTLDYSHLKILQDYARQFEGAMATIKEGKLYRVRETPLNSSNYSILSGRKIFDNGTIIPLIEQYVAHCESVNMAHHGLREGFLKDATDILRLFKSGQFVEGKMSYGIIFKPDDTIDSGTIAWDFSFKNR